MHNKRILPLLILVLLFSACGGSAVSAAPMEKYSSTMFDAFDTQITLTAWCDSSASFETLRETAEQEFLRLHRLFDIYHETDGITSACTLNRTAALAPVSVDEDLFSLLLIGQELCEQTKGRVNMAMGAVLKIWHTYREYNNAFPIEPRLPSDEELREAAMHTRIEDVILDETQHTVFFADPQLSLDLGAIAKGYAVEVVCDLLVSRGYTGFAVNAGGNVKTVGLKPDGSVWNVSITDPVPAEGRPAAAAVAVTNRCVVTSGIYQRYFTVDGVRYHHIIDPETLFPENRYLSVTVLAEDSALADGYSTALFNMDYEQGRALADACSSVEVLWIFPDQTLVYTEGFHPSAIYY